MYDPGPNHLTVVSLKSNKALADSFLTLGFGGSGKDLAAKMADHVFRGWNL